MAWNPFNARQLADLTRVKSGNIYQRIAGGIGQIGSVLNLPEFGVSEYFGTPSAQAAETPTSSFGPNNPANYPQKPADAAPDNPSAGTGTSGSGSTAASGENLAAYLKLINQQRGILQNQYTTGYGNINSTVGRQGAAVSAKANQNIYDINQSMSEAEKTGAENTQLIRTGADTARYNTKQGITSNFQARGAIDSSYFQRAMDAGLGDINNQEKTQLTAVTKALDKARNEATKQKNSIQMDLDIAMQDLEAKRQASLAELETQYNSGMITLAQLENEANAPVTNFASTEELNRIQALADTNFAVDQYITQIDQQAQGAISQIQSSASATKQAGIDMSNVTNLLGSLSKGLKAGYRKADFVPLLVSKGYTPEQAQSILDQAEVYGQQVTTNAPVPQPA